MHLIDHRPTTLHPVASGGRRPTVILHHCNVPAVVQSTQRSDRIALMLHTEHCELPGGVPFLIAADQLPATLQATNTLLWLDFDHEWRLLHARPRTADELAKTA